MNERKLSSAYKKYEKRGQLLEEIDGNPETCADARGCAGAEDAAAEADDVFSVFEPPEGQRWFFFTVFLYGLCGLSVCGSQRDDARTGTDEGGRTDSDGREENLAGGEKTAVKISGYQTPEPEAGVSNVTVECPLLYVLGLNTNTFRAVAPHTHCVHLRAPPAYC